MKTTLALMLLLPFAANSVAQEQDVDCETPKTRVARLVCASPELLSLGGEIASAYTAALPLSESPAAEVRLRFEWLKRVDRCNKSSDDDLAQCVTAEYAARMEQVNARLSDLKASASEKHQAVAVQPYQHTTQSAGAPQPQGGVSSLNRREFTVTDRTPAPSDHAPATTPPAVTGATAPSTSTSQTQESESQRAGETAVAVIAFVLLVGLVAFSVYFAPALVAFSRRHRNRWLILLINVVFGATVLGWLIALIWAMNRVDDPLKGGIKHDYQPYDPVV